jgi:hypothetical protein
MLPNSRIIPPNNSKQPLNSAAGLYESKRGFIDSIRTNSSVIPPASKPKYESVLGMAERYEQWNSQKPKKETIEIQQSISTDSKKVR